MYPDNVVKRVDGLLFCFVRFGGFDSSTLLGKMIHQHNTFRKEAKESEHILREKKINLIINHSRIVRISFVRLRSVITRMFEWNVSEAHRL